MQNDIAPFKMLSMSFLKTCLFVYFGVGVGVILVLNDNYLYQPMISTLWEIARQYNNYDEYEVL